MLQVIVMQMMVMLVAAVFMLVHPSTLSPLVCPLSPWFVDGISFINQGNNSKPGLVYQ